MPEPNLDRKTVVVTCGPGYEPLDEVRRLTNHSTGRLGSEFSTALAGAGLRVLCLRGISSTWYGKIPGAEIRTFATAEDLRVELEGLGEAGNVAAVFHAAALSDFRVKGLTDACGRPLPGKKISSRLGELQLTLEPAPKLISLLRDYFPGSLLVGWKYELDGGREDVLQAGLRQMAENRTDACVLNGAAYGPGFGVCEKGRPAVHFESEKAMFAHWIGRLGR